MSAWVCVDDDEEEIILGEKPFRTRHCWMCDTSIIYLPKGSIKKLIGHTLTWADEAVQLKNKPLNLII